MKKSVVFLGILLVNFHAFAAKDVTDTQANLSCTTAGHYADGKKIKGTGIERISVDIKRINWNKDEPRKAPAWGSMSNIKVKSGTKDVEANLVKSEPQKVAFAFSNDAEIDGDKRTELVIYEISLDSLKSRRSVMTIFSQGSNSLVAYEGNCVKN